MVYFHGAVTDRAEDSDDGHFSDGHLAEILQIIITLLHIHVVLSFWSSDQLEVGEKEQILLHSIRFTGQSPRTLFGMEGWY